jgi:hypothetical protein
MANLYIIFYDIPIEEIGVAFALIYITPSQNKTRLGSTFEIYFIGNYK